MFKALKEKFRSTEKDFLLFILVGVFIGIAQSIDGATMNNFYKEKFHILIMQRSLLEMPRELPGFLVFMIVGFLYALGDIRIAAISNLVAAVGLFFLGIIPANFSLMLVFIFIYSVGQHVYMPFSSSIGMSFAKDENVGRKLGKLSAANTTALVISSAILFLLLKFFNIGYRTVFTIGSIALVIASLLLFSMSKKNTVPFKKRFVFKKKYYLFYWLSILFGARKQIFITFGPWVLVDIFKQSVSTMTILFFIISVLSIFMKPFIGHLIDKFGERLVLSLEAALLIFVCLGYAFATDILPYKFALILVCVCYISDLTLNAVGMARATYVRKIAETPEDISPTLSLGVSIDHILSMFLPAIGGYIWYSNGDFGYKYVFIGGAIIALINLISTRRIKILTVDK